MLKLENADIACEKDNNSGPAKGEPDSLTVED